MKLVRRTLGALLLLILAGGGAFHFRVEHLVYRPVPSTTGPAQISTADQYYFAYGANMPTRYLYNVRGVLPAQSEPGMIENYEVGFLAPGINALEPAFAYLLKAEGKQAYGVLHRISSQDLNKVKESEGADYEWVTLPVKMGNGQVVTAQTLVRLSRGDVGTPSKRYLAVLIEGATEHGLPAAYVVGLQSMPSVYVPIASELMGDILEAVVMKRSGKCASVVMC